MVLKTSSYRIVLKTSSYRIGSFKRDFHEHQLPSSYKYGTGFKQPILLMYIDSIPHFHGLHEEIFFFFITIVVGKFHLDDNNITI